FQCIKPAAEQRNFLQLAVEECFKQSSGEGQPMILGIDASIWMYQAERALNFKNTAAGPNPHLRILFYKLVALLELPIRVVFVFDGVGRPDIKRGINVNTSGHRLTNSFCELIRLFGYHSHTAPGEAEAELARMNLEGVLDAVETTDSDTLVFGASTVIIIPQKKVDGKNITLYTAENIFITPGVSITRGGLLLIALLVGGDYNKARTSSQCFDPEFTSTKQGIPGCGAVIAHAIACSNLGDSLLTETLLYPYVTDHLLTFLVAWRAALCLEFSTDPHGYLGRKHKAIAAAITNTPSFPDINVLFAYVHPTTSWSEGFTLPNHRLWGLAHPNTAGITVFCENHFGWSTSDIAVKFRKLLYSGVAIQSLLKVCACFLIPTLAYPATFSLMIYMRYSKRTWSWA
ncbi:PIN domain-like protein, partial [Mycena sp. CBHHK59/15]